MSQLSARTPTHDVVVIGSGAGGGTVTKVLADLGISVLLLEAGPMLEPCRSQRAHVAVRRPASGRRPAGGRVLRPIAVHVRRDIRRIPDRRRAVHRRPWQRLLAGSDRASSAAARTTTAASRCASPTTTSSRRNGTALVSTGRSATRTSRRITTRPRRFIGVTGTKEGIRSAPDGIFNPPAPLRAHDVLVQRSCAKLGIRAIPARRRSRRFRATAVRRATTADSAGADARPRRTTRPATCRSFRRCRRAA